MSLIIEFALITFFIDEIAALAFGLDGDDVVPVAFLGEARGLPGEPGKPGDDGGEIARDKDDVVVEFAFVIRLNAVVAVSCGIS